MHYIRRVLLCIVDVVVVPIVAVLGEWTNGGCVPLSHIIHDMEGLSSEVAATLNNGRDYNRISSAVHLCWKRFSMILFIVLI